MIFVAASARRAFISAARKCPRDIGQSWRQSSSQNAPPKRRFRKFATLIVVIGTGFAAYYTYDQYEKKAAGIGTTATIPVDQRKNLVILGSGWGAVSLLKDLDPNKYNVTIVSPRNYFTFTPLLPAAAVGTLEHRSLAMPIRQLFPWATFIHGKAEDLDPTAKTCNVICRDGSTAILPYHHLVIGVGALVNTFGLPGVDKYCHFVKDIQDAVRLRKSLIGNLELAALPTTSEDEKRRLLTIVVCGGGPTGVETAAEVSDMLKTDAAYNYGKEFIEKNAQVVLIQSADHVLNTYDAKISEYAENNFKLLNVKVLMRQRVTEVTDKTISVRNKDTGEVYQLPYGVSVWSTGVSLSPFTRKVIERFAGNQRNRKCLEVNDHLQLLGTEDGSITAIGDCATLFNYRLLDQVVTLFREGDRNSDDRISFAEFQSFAIKLRKRYPRLAVHLDEAERLFRKYDADQTCSLNLDEFRTLLVDVSRELKSFPATAQAAAQMGTYLAHRLNKADEEAFPPPFVYKHMGMLAYVGGERAAIDLGNGVIMNGLGAMWMWKSVYLAKQVTLRTRYELLTDWIKTWLFGRNTSG